MILSFYIYVILSFRDSVITWYGLSEILSFQGLHFPWFCLSVILSFRDSVFPWFCLSVILSFCEYISLCFYLSLTFTPSRFLYLVHVWLRPCDESNLGVSGLCDLEGRTLTEPTIWGKQVSRKLGLFITGSSSNKNVSLQSSKSLRSFILVQFWFGPSSKTEIQTGKSEWWVASSSSNRDRAKLKIYQSQVLSVYEHLHI